MAKFGDWAHLVADLEPLWLYRAILAKVGGGRYSGAIVLGWGKTVPLVGDGPDRIQRARTLCIVPYLAGGVLMSLRGHSNPVSPLLVLIPAAAAAFGGVSALAWMTELLPGPGYPAASGVPLAIDRSLSWIAFGATTALLFVAVLGPGLRF